MIHIIEVIQVGEYLLCIGVLFLLGIARNGSKDHVTVVVLFLVVDGRGVLEVGIESNGIDGEMVSAQRIVLYSLRANKHTYHSPREEQCCDLVLGR